jgi:hypothetical protein
LRVENHPKATADERLIVGDEHSYQRALSKGSRASTR